MQVSRVNEVVVFLLRVKFFLFFIMQIEVLLVFGSKNQGSFFIFNNVQDGIYNKVVFGFKYQQLEYCEKFCGQMLLKVF